MWSAFVPHSLLARTEFDAQKRPVNAHLFPQHTPTVSRSAGVVIRLVVLRSRKECSSLLMMVSGTSVELGNFQSTFTWITSFEPHSVLVKEPGNQNWENHARPLLSRAVPDSWHLYTSWALRARAALWEMVCHSVGQGLVAHQSERQLAPFCRLGK